MIVVWILIAAIVILIAVLLGRTLMFKPKAQELPERHEVDFDREAAISALQQLVRCKTIS